MTAATPINLVLLPGLMSDDWVWQAQIEALGDRCSLQIIDYGALDSLGAMAGRCLEEAPARFALAGHSMGGRVALEVMRSVLHLDARRVTHLALLDTGCHAMPAGEAGERERATRLAFLTQAREHGVEAMARRWVEGMVHPSRLHDSALLEEIVRMFGRRDVPIFSAQIHALLHRPEAADLLPRIRCPTLVLTGDADANSPPAANREMAQAIPGASLKVLERCGHMSMSEQPALVNAALLEWLERTK